MEKAISSLKKSIKLAFKSVFYHWKQYLCFFVSIFAVEMLLCLITISSDTNMGILSDFIEADYDYHLELKNLNDQQYYYLVNTEANSYHGSIVFETVRTAQRGSPEHDNIVHDVYYRFTGTDPEANYRTFKNRYFPVLDQYNQYNKNGRVPYTYLTTPLLSNASEVGSMMFTYRIVMLSVSAFAVLLITILYRRRVNSFRFEYGIYMSFGADFRRLFQTSFSEILIVTVITYLPAVIVAILMNLIIYVGGEHQVVFGFWSIFKILPLSLIISSVAVIFPMLAVSKTTPVKNIITEDNSNYVTSPRMSFDLFDKRHFVRTCEVRSFWRFRKYYIGLIASAVCFAAAFVMTVYISNLYQTSTLTDSPEFELTFLPEYGSDTYISKEMDEELYGIEGVIDIEKEVSRRAPDLTSHVLFRSENAAPFSGFVNADEYQKEPGWRAMNQALYCACDEYVIKGLEKYDHDGDYASLLNEEHTVIVTDSRLNTKTLNIKPGDKIRIAVYERMKGEISDYDEGQALLRAQLVNMKFRYVEFTVGAVVHGSPTGENIPIYFSQKDYEEVLGLNFIFPKASVYIRDHLSPEEVKSIEAELWDWSEMYGNVDITRTYASSRENIEEAKHAPIFIACVSVSVLLIIPMIWFFTQILFFFKRENEFTLLQAIGAQKKDIRNICLMNGAYCSAVGVVLYTLLSFAAMFAIGKICNTYAVSLGSLGGIVRYSYEMPVLPFIAGLLMTAVSGFLSSLLPGLTYLRKTEKQQNPAEYFGD